MKKLLSLFKKKIHALYRSSFNHGQKMKTVSTEFTNQVTRYRLHIKESSFVIFRRDITVYYRFVIFRRDFTVYCSFVNIFRRDFTVYCISLFLGDILLFIIQHIDTLPKYGQKTRDVRRST